MAWTNKSKDWDYDRPLHRINSPDWMPQNSRVDGKGYGRGCHAPSDGPNDSVYGLIIRELARTIPGWVSVAGEKEQEVEGPLDRCFQTWTDVPLYQWHRFYDWNFHLAPIDGYAYVRGMGNEESKERAKLPSSQRLVTAGNTMECEWDCGAFGQRPGAMFNNAQWIWPMTGQYCWITGRWIYDCGHASSNDKTGAKEGLMRSELHPCKAMATAQWEAVSFEENGNLFVPGIRVQFFASRCGGYKVFQALNGSDYEFIVDLPKNKGVTSDWRIGHTPDFPLNTAVLRAPHLLHHFDYITTATGSYGTVAPVIEPIPNDVPGELPQQVKVTIPLTGLDKSIDYYGVIIKLGWYDPDQSQARKVKRCVVHFTHIHKGDIDHDDFAEEWMLKFGVNGRWFLRNFTGVSNGDNLQLEVPEQIIYLGEDDSIYVTCHGAELDLVDDVFQRTDDDRTLKLDDVKQNWDVDIVPSTPPPGKLWDLCYEAADMMWSTFNDTNDPLGIIDPLGTGQLARGGTADNPLPVKTLNFSKAGHTQVAFFTEEVGDSAELVENSTRIDYTLFYDVSVEPQLA